MIEVRLGRLLQALYEMEWKLLKSIASSRSLVSSTFPSSCCNLRLIYIP